MTQAFWQRRDQFDLCTGETAQREIERTQDAPRRAQILARLAELTVHPLTADMEALAEEYIRAAIFSEALREDALHVAAAVLTRQDVLLSWNFKHLVNRRRKAAVIAVNLRRGLPSVDVVAPPEL